MTAKPLAAKYQVTLRAATFDDAHPGALLHDFALLLDHVGEAGVKAGGKYNLLPLEAIPALDPKLARPLNLDLKRPQLRSHPYLQGLHLLARASGMVRVEGTGSKARLAIDPRVKASWEGLNPTERYFALLGAWMIVARSTILGEGDSLGGSLLGDLMMSGEAGRRGGLPYRMLREAYHLALLDLFGWLHPKTPFGVAGAWDEIRPLQLTPLGAAMVHLLGTLEPSDQDDFDEDEVGPEAFGRLQQVFQPFFPAWLNNLAMPAPSLEGRAGVYVWKLAFGGRKAWRLLALAHDHTLEDLMYAILRAIDFSSDHMYEFRYRDALGREAVAIDPRAEDGMPADDVTLGSLPLKVGESLHVTYDFGDNWRFDVKLERIDPPGSVKKLPALLESHGEAPQQYPDWD